MEYSESLQKKVYKEVRKSIKDSMSSAGATHFISDFHVHVGSSIQYHSQKFTDKELASAIDSDALSEFIFSEIRKQMSVFTNKYFDKVIVKDMVYDIVDSWSGIQKDCTEESEAKDFLKSLDSKQSYLLEKFYSPKA